MAEDADSDYQKLLWDAALESMGRDTVRIRLNNMPADRSAAFKLPGQRSCKRGYAEDWLGRGDAKEKALEVRQPATPSGLRPSLLRSALWPLSLQWSPHGPWCGPGSSSPTPFLATGKTT